MLDKKVEQPTQDPPGEKHFRGINDLELAIDDFTFAELVKKGELVSVDFEQGFLGELLSDIRKGEQSIPQEDVRAMEKIHLTDISSKKIILTEENTENVYRFLSAVCDLDFLVDLTERERSELQIVSGNSLGGHTISRQTGYGQKKARTEIPINQDDKNLYLQSLPLRQKDRSVGDPLSYLEQRMDIIIGQLSKVVNGVELQRFSHTDQVSFAIEWAILRTVYAANKLGIFPLER